MPKNQETLRGERAREGKEAIEEALGVVAVIIALVVVEESAESGRNIITIYENKKEGK